MSINQLCPLDMEAFGILTIPNHSRIGVLIYINVCNIIDYLYSKPYLLFSGVLVLLSDV